MAQLKNQQNPVGNRNIPAPEPVDPEQEGFLRDFTKLTEKVRGIIKRATNVSTPEGETLISAGEEREKMLKEAEVALTEARSLAIKIHRRTAGNIDMKKLLKSELPGEIQTARKQNEDEVKAAERAAKDKKDLEKKEAEDMAELEMQDRFDRGVETDEDKQIMRARKEKELQTKLVEKKLVVRKTEIKPIEDALPSVDADIDYGDYDKAGAAIIVLESNLPRLEILLAQEEQELARVNIDPAQDPFIIFFKGQIQQLRSSIEKLRGKNEGKKQEFLQRKADKDAEAAQKNAQSKKGDLKVQNPVQEKKTDGPESLEELGIRFEGIIASLANRIPVVLALPLTTLKEVDAASDALALLRKDVDACISEYKAKIGAPIIRPLFEKFPDSRDRDVSGRAFTKLDRERAGLQNGFLGNSAKGIVGTYQDRKNELSTRRDELRAAERETIRAAQEARLAEYEQSAAKLEEKIAPIRERMLEAKTKVGDERDAMLKEIRSSLSSLKDEWQVLRKDAPAQAKGDQTVTVRDRMDSAIGCSFSSKGKDIVVRGTMERELDEMLHGEEKKNKREKWEAEFPAFEINIALISNQIFDAMMLGGKERRALLELQQTALKAAEEVWKELRSNGPWLSDEDWAAKKFSPVKAMDRKLEEMREHVERILPLAEGARGIRIDSENWPGFARDWISSVIRVEQFWNPESGLNERGPFMERFIFAEMPKDDEEFLSIVLEAQREDFLKYIEDSNVCRGIVKIARMEKREAAQEAQRTEKQKEEQKNAERNNLRHPQLNVLRNFEGKIFHDFKNGAFWKKEISERTEEHLIKNGAEMHDEELEKFISDIPAFREALARLQSIRKDILALEDTLLRGEEPDSKRDAEGVQKALNGYFQQSRAERIAWDKALNANGWTISKKDRKAQLQAIWRAGSLEGVPDVLRGAIEQWIQARMRLNESEEYVQWVLNANPDVAQGMKIPAEFRVERDVSLPVVAEASVTDGSAVEDAADTNIAADTFTEDPDLEASPEEQSDANAVALQALLDRNAAKGAIGDSAEPVVSEEVSAAPVIDAALVARQEAERIAHVRKEIVDSNWTTIRNAFGDSMFWDDDADHKSATWSKNLKAFLRLPIGATMSSELGLRDDRKADFYSLAAFTNLADLLRRFVEIRMKYPAETSASAAPVEPTIGPVAEAAPFRGPLAPMSDAELAAAAPAPVAAALPSATGSLTGSFSVPRRLSPVGRPVRPYIPPAPAPITEVASVQSNVPSVEPSAPEAPVQTPPPQELVSLSSDPYERFFGSRPVPVAVEQPASAPRVENPRGEVPLIQPTRPVVAARRAPVFEDIPVPQNPAELRVSGWARSVRETVGKWFGADVADIATREVTGMPSDRERRGEAPSNTEVAYRTLGSVMSVVGSVFGFKAFADVPRYLTQSFCTSNERALLQADILDAMEQNSAARQRAGSDPEASLRANAEAAARTDRAIATSAYLTDAQKVEMRARVADLQAKYTERTRENVAARSKELANVLENAVQNRVTGWGAAKETANTALRVMAFADVPVGAVRGVTYGVMAFRDRFEKAATKNPEASFVGNVANVFRSTWADTWGKLTKQTNNFRERVTNVGDAMATIATAVGMAAVTIGSLEEALPGLRMVAGGGAESEGVASLIAEGRSKLQEMIDKVLPTYERLAKRTV